MYLDTRKYLCKYSVFTIAASRIACIVSIVCTWILDHVSVSILCILLLRIPILRGLQSLLYLYITYISGQPDFWEFLIGISLLEFLILCYQYETFCLSFQTRTANPLVGRCFIYITIVFSLWIPSVQRFFHISVASLSSFLFNFVSLFLCCHIQLIFFQCQLKLEFKFSAFFKNWMEFLSLLILNN